MTGAYLRVKRDGKWENVEIDQMTDAELNDFFAVGGKENAVRWAMFLAGWIRDNVKEEA